MVRWRLVPGEGGRRFRLSWTETGGPPVSAPEHKGFGSQLIRSAVVSELAGKAELRFPVEGVHFTLDADASRVLAEMAAAPAA